MSPFKSGTLYKINSRIRNKQKYRNKGRNNGCWKSGKPKVKLTMEEAASLWGILPFDLGLYICKECCYIHSGHNPVQDREYEINEPRAA